MLLYHPRRLIAPPGLVNNNTNNPNANDIIQPDNNGTSPTISEAVTVPLSPAYRIRKQAIWWAVRPRIGSAAGSIPSIGGPGDNISNTIVRSTQHTTDPLGTTAAIGLGGISQPVVDQSATNYSDTGVGAAGTESNEDCMVVNLSVNVSPGEVTTSDGGVIGIVGSNVVSPHLTRES